MVNKNLKRKLRRKKRVSSGISGTAERPRISVYRSNKSIYAQAIDDDKAVTLASYSSHHLKSKDKKNKTEKSQEIGSSLAKILKDKKIKKAVFDRGPYAYLGRVKALAEGLREGGIKI